METGLQIVVPVDVREMTLVESEFGEIHVIHEITLGDLLVTTAIAALLIFSLITKAIKQMGGKRNV